MKASAKTEAEVVAVLNQFLANYKNRDLKGLMAFIAPDDDVFMFGTGMDEKRIGREQFKFQAERDWSQTDELNFALNPYHISEAGSVVWVAADGMGKGKAGGQEIIFPMRLTAVLERRDGNWFLVQTHLSVPASGQAEGDSMPM
jgi:ketosteroid isomerase-like protein